VKLRRAFGLLLGVVAQILVPLVVEGLAPPDPEARTAYVPQSFAETVDALDRFEADRGRVPSAEEGLAALVPDYLPALPLDPWTRKPYLYEPAPDGSSAELLTYGEDGRDGGTGTNADLSLRALEMGPPPPPPDPMRARLVNLSFLAPALLAFLASLRWNLAAAVLSGSTLFTAILLVWAALARLQVGSALLPPLVTAAACACFGYGALRGRWKGLALLSVGIAWLQLTALA
jgi:general secretion pathway protein G